MFVPTDVRRAGELSSDDLEEFKRLCSQSVDPSLVPTAHLIEQNIPIYLAEDVGPLALSSQVDRQRLMDEFYRCLLHGPGVFAIKGLMAKSIAERADEVAEKVTPDEFRSHPQRRLFGFGEKHVCEDPENYAEYYSNPLIALVSEAWLGPAYQVTTSYNSIKRGAPEQAIHRDYHGLNPDYPLTTQVISQMLTLQCAIAHTPQPLEKGPTRFMPFSNHFAKGYIAVKSAEYYGWVSPRMSQMPLEVGDAVFFNPATFHQPGVNPAEEQRSMNLFQVNSCMSRSMESKNTLKMTKALWPVLRKWAADCPDFAVHAKGSERPNGSASDRNGHRGACRHPLEIEALIAATSEGYNFPRSFWKQTWEGKDASQTEAEIVKRALVEAWDQDRLFLALDEHHELRRP